MRRYSKNKIYSSNSIYLIKNTEFLMSVFDFFFTGVSVSVCLDFGGLGGTPKASYL